MLTTFRNGTSRHDWGEWARRVRVFVNNPGANSVLHGWAIYLNTTTDCNVVNTDVSNTPTNQYIRYIQ